MNVKAYYNEIDPYAAQWLRNLIAAGHIAPGDVDERSIVDVRADDLRGYAQAHFFAGIGGWSIALRLAGWPDDRPVWTGSCPCQPFSAAGAGKAADDGRHLWPSWFPLIAERRPSVVFGEQVEAAIGWGWLDAVYADMEGAGYACAAAVLPACGVGAPHIRNRLWFVADSSSERRQQNAGSTSGDEKEGGRARWDGSKPNGDHELSGDGADGHAGELGDAESIDGRLPEGQVRQQDFESARSGKTGELGNADGARLPERVGDGRVQRQTMGPHSGQTIECGSALSGFWHDAEWIDCTDGKARPVGPGSFPLGHGIQRRTSKLRAYGNAIVPQVAAQFIAATQSIGTETTA